MAIGQINNLVIYEEQFYAGMYESIYQNVIAFNGASENAIRLVQKELKGQYDKESFWKAISGLISRRDMTSILAATDKAMTQDEVVGVKVNRKIGPVAQTIGSLLKVASTPQEMSLILGQIVGQEKLKDLLNTSMIAAAAAVKGQAALVFDATTGTTKTATHTALIKGLAKFGDAASRVRCFVMHSKPYFDLLGQALNDKIVNIADVVIVQGSIATLGRPTIVTDSPALWNIAGEGGTDTYTILGLVQNAVTATESEEENIVSQSVTGLEQLAVRIQGEYAFNLNVKGFKWDVTNGGPGPTDASLAVGTNWDKTATSDKDTAGVAIIVQGAE